jgi:hypothetical protein
MTGSTRVEKSVHKNKSQVIYKMAAARYSGVLKQHLQGADHKGCPIFFTGIQS